MTICALLVLTSFILAHETGNVRAAESCHEASLKCISRDLRKFDVSLELKLFNWSFSGADATVECQAEVVQGRCQCGERDVQVLLEIDTDCQLIEAREYNDEWTPPVWPPPITITLPVLTTSDATLPDDIDVTTETTIADDSPEESEELPETTTSQDVPDATTPQEELPDNTQGFTETTLSFRPFCSRANGNWFLLFIVFLLLTAISLSWNVYLFVLVRRSSSNVDETMNKNV